MKRLQELLPWNLAVALPTHLPEGKRLTDGTFTPATYVSVEVSFRPVPPVSTRNQTVRVCTYNVTSFAH